MAAFVHYALFDDRIIILYTLPRQLKVCHSKISVTKKKYLTYIILYYTNSLSKTEIEPLLTTDNAGTDNCDI